MLAILPKRPFLSKNCAKLLIYFDMCKKKIIFFITKYLRTPPVSFVNSLAIPPKVRSHFCANHKLSVQKIRLCEHRLIFVHKSLYV